jgi:hypothetical protein
MRRGVVGTEYSHVFTAMYTTTHSRIWICSRHTFHKNDRFEDFYTIFVRSRKWMLDWGSRNSHLGGKERRLIGKVQTWMFV